MSSNGRGAKSGSFATTTHCSQAEARLSSHQSNRALFSKVVLINWVPLRMYRPGIHALRMLNFLCSLEAEKRSPVPSILLLPRLFLFINWVSIHFLYRPGFLSCREESVEFLRLSSRERRARSPVPSPRHLDSPAQHPPCSTLVQQRTDQAPFGIQRW